MTRLFGGKERPNGIGTHQWCIPSLRAFLLQEPTLHLLDGGGVGGIDGLHCLNGGHLGRYAIVAPTVIGTGSIEIESHLGSGNGIFFQALQIFLGFGYAPVTGQKHGRGSLSVDGETYRSTCQTVNHIALVGSNGPAIERGGVSVVTKLVGGNDVLRSPFLQPLHLGHLFGGFKVEKGESSVYHGLHPAI